MRLLRCLKVIATALVLAVGAGCTAVPPDSPGVTLRGLGIQKLPPRSIDDLLAVLEQPHPGQPSRECAAKLRADARSAVRLRDDPYAGLRDQTSIAPAIAQSLRTYLLEVLAAEQIGRGEFRDAEVMLTRAISTAPAEFNRAHLSRFQILLARIRAYAGDEAGARAFGDQARSSASAATVHDDDRSRFTIQAIFLQAEAMASYGRGDAAQAANALNRLLAVAVDPEDARAASFFIDIDSLRADLARLLLIQDQPVNAEGVLREGLRMNFAARRTAEWRASNALRLAALLAEALIDQNRSDDAQAVTERAVRLADSLCIPPGSVHLAAARSMAARLAGERSAWQEVANLFARLQVDLRDHPEAFERLYAGNTDYALSDILLGRVAAARARIERATGRVTGIYGESSFANAELTMLTAIAKVAAGDIEDGLSDQRRYRAMLAKLPPREGGRTDRRRRQLTDIFLDLVVEQFARRGIDPALRSEMLFGVASTAFGSRVQSAIVAATARSDIADPRIAGLAREAQDADATAAILSEALAGLTGTSIAGADVERIASLRESMQRSRDRSLALRQRIEAAVPEYAELIRPKPPSLSEIASLLQPDEAFIQTHTTSALTLAWAVTASGESGLAVAQLGRADLREAVERLRLGLDLSTRAGDPIPPFDVDHAQQIFAQLLAPTHPLWRGARHLIVSADGDLARLPFAVLPVAPSGRLRDRSLLFDRYRDVAWLGSGYALSAVPTATVLRALRPRPTASGPTLPFIGFGDPAYGAEAHGASDSGLRGLRAPIRTRQARTAALADLPRLPDTADEILAVARTLGADPARDVFLDRRASDQQVAELNRQSLLGRYRVISFATHGLLPGDIDGLAEPAIALSPTAGSDGLLTMSEVIGLQLSADWVVLSACNTAGGQSETAEAISGLGRAFLFAGGRSLLVSHWPVFSASTTALMVDLFERYGREPGQARAQHLRAAMSELRDRGSVEIDGRQVSFAHPLFWAPFVLVGNGR